MVQRVKADGALRHRFWGTYSAVIALEFDSEEHAAGALRTLGPPWDHGAKARQCLVCVVSRSELEAVKRTLGGYGANVSAIDSIRRSVDYGEPFSVEVPILPQAERPAGWRERFEDVSGAMAQASLFGGE